MKDKFNMLKTKIPDFSLPNTRGDRVNITSFSGSKNVVIVLLRGLMNLFTQQHVYRLGRDREKFEALNTEIYAITADRFENARRLDLRYAREKIPIYFDKDREVVKLLKQDVKIFRLGRLPAVLIIDKDAIIRWAYFGDSLMDIPTNKKLFEILETL